jgi:hypothetical protein
MCVVENHHLDGEEDGVLLVPNAGEMPYRLRE